MRVLIQNVPLGMQQPKLWEQVATEEITCLVKPEDRVCIHKNPHS